MFNGFFMTGQIAALMVADVIGRVFFTPVCNTGVGESTCQWR
jgi:hypothetical protein